MARRAQIHEQASLCKNPAVATHLLELYESAAARNDRLQFVYRRAVQSVIDHPEPILEARDLERLRGIGPNIRARIEKRCTEAGLELAVGGAGAVTVATAAECANATQPVAPPRGAQKTAQRQAREYVPAYRSGPYAMLVALQVERMRAEAKGYLLKHEIVQSGQQYCESSLDEGRFSAIQGAIKTLLAKDLVQKWSHPARFSLTDSGADLAERIWNSAERRTSVAASEAPAPPQTMAPSAAPLESFSLPRGSFDVVLLVDSRETKSKEERTFIADRLGQAGVRAEQRSLPLGDFLWVARSRPEAGSQLDEVVLDFIVERKREDDLISSILDGRFREQKRVLYLVERCDNVDLRVIGRDRLNAAIMQTQVVDRFFLRHTTGLEDSIRFLSRMTHDISAAVLSEGTGLCAGIMHGSVAKDTYLEYLRQNPPLRQSFGCFAQINSKSANLTTKDLFTKQLLTIRHLTADKAEAIVALFPTVISLWRFYQGLESTGERERYFEDWTAGQARRKFGRALSERIHQVICGSYDADAGS